MSDVMSQTPTTNPTTPAAAATPEVTTTPAKPAEYSTGAKAAIGAGIGVGNLCCGPFCYMCPTIVSSIIGFVLYASWRKDRPETAKTILWVTIITGALAFVFFGILFAIGMASSLVDGASNYNY